MKIQKTTKNVKKSRFEPFFGDLVVVHRVHLWLDGIWKAHCQLPICDNWTYFDSSHGRGTTKRNLTKSAFFEGWVTLIANCRHMGTSPAFHLWTVRWGNDVATTLLLEVFTQRNFVADFFDKSWNFTGKNSNIAFWGLRGNAHGSSMAYWKARGRLPVIANWTLFAIFHFWGTVSRYWPKLLCSKRGMVTLSANFRGSGGRPPTTVGVRKLECLGYHVALYAWSYV